MVPPDSTTAEDQAFLRVFAEATGARPVSFARFMELALFHPEVGYYRRDRQRVGRSPGTDFYTASSAGTVFGELVSGAAAVLIEPAEAKDFTFVELGAEPDTSVLDGVAHPFGATRVVRLGESLQLTGRCVVFSNELFDAQPCHRVIFRSGAWRETGVRIGSSGLEEIELAAPSATVRTFSAQLPANAPEGYRIDLPLAAAQLAHSLAAQSWQGFFLAFDYGKTWPALRDETPGGTVRAYSRHQQSNELLAQPGRQDLTCHVCWDWIGAELMAHDFRSPQVDSQEAFFLRRAPRVVQRLLAAEPGHRPSERKNHLHQLLHPALQGQKFQVLHAKRGI